MKMKMYTNNVKMNIIKTLTIMFRMLTSHLSQLPLLGKFIFLDLKLFVKTVTIFSTMTIMTEYFLRHTCTYVS